MEQKAALSRLWAAIESLHNQVIKTWVDNDVTHASSHEGWPAAVELFEMQAWFPLLQLDPPTDIECAHTRALRRMNNHIAWALHKRNQFKQLAEASKCTIGKATASWVQDLTSVPVPGDTTQWACRQHTVSANYVEQLSQLAVVSPDCSRNFISQQYSVEFQLQVLHLDIDQIAEPVLDIGCGKERHFVQWLRRQQKRAMGIDLFVESMSDCVSIDWFDFPFVPNHFGTIIAHLSFSLQFLTHHLDAHGQAEQYARLFMNILRSLQVGGRFIYVPGLPFIEKLLPPDCYRVERHVIADLPEDHQGSEIFNRHLAEDPMYCCHIERSS